MNTLRAFALVNAATSIIGGIDIMTNVQTVKHLAVVISLTCALVPLANAQRPSTIRKPVEPSYFAEPFDRTLEKLPPRFTGNLHDKLPDELIQRYRLSQKDEFETTEQYRKRLTDLERNPLFGSVLQRSTIAFPFLLGPDFAKYDADASTLNVMISGAVESGGFILRTSSKSRLFSIVRFGEGYKQVIGQVGDVNGSDSKQSSDCRPWEERGCSVGLKMPPELARAAKESLALLIVGTLSDPFMVVGSDSFIRMDVSEIWLYNFLTGEVYDKRRLGCATFEVYRVVPCRVASPEDSNKNPGSEVNVPKTITGGVLNSRATNLVKPSYPAAARAVKASGAVNVQVTIDESGNVISASAVSGHPLLRAAAVQAARSSIFSPTLLSGQPVKVTGILVYNFVLEASGR